MFIVSRITIWSRLWPKIDITDFIRFWTCNLANYGLGHTFRYSDWSCLQHCWLPDMTWQSQRKELVQVNHELYMW